MQSPTGADAIVYIDGFNFYYGCFKNRSDAWKACKWLNVEVFCDLTFPNYQIRQIRYFTARVEPNPLDPGVELRQSENLRALQTLPRVSLHEGKYSTHRKERYLADPNSLKPSIAQPPQKVLIFIQEEKGSDVNLAAHLISDGYKNRYDTAIVISNDSDLYEPIRLVAAPDELNRPVLLVNPHPQRIATQLQQIAGVSYWRLDLNKLQMSQFPPTISDSAGTISKPASWL